MSVYLISFIASVLLAGPVVVGYLAFLVARMLDRQASVLRKVDKLGLVAEATHVLVNSQMETQLANMEVQLKLHAGTTKRLAAITGEQIDIDAEAVADKLYADHKRVHAQHQAKQRVVDAMPGTDEDKKGKT